MSYYKLNDGKELYYEEIGEGTPVVFLHGWYRANVSSPFSSAAFADSTHMLIAEHPDEFARKLSDLL